MTLELKINYCNSESTIHETRHSQDGDISPHYTAISTSHTG